MYSIFTLLKLLRSRRLIFLQLILAFVITNICYSQNNGDSDSSRYVAQLRLFDEAVGTENTDIINGTKYIVPLQVSGSHPFYNAATGVNGNVTFLDQPYSNLTLLYDIYSDELIVQQRRATGTYALIKLYKENVESFSIHDHTFRNYQGNRAQALGMVGGFYDVLYENAVFSLIAKRKKKTYVEANGMVQYEIEDQYFFIHQGRLTPFRGMKNFYQVLDDKSRISELRTFVNKNNLEIKKRDSDLIAVARQCDTILNTGK